MAAITHERMNQLLNNTIDCKLGNFAEYADGDDGKRLIDRMKAEVVTRWTGNREVLVQIWHPSMILSFVCTSVDVIFVKWVEEEATGYEKELRASHRDLFRGYYVAKVQEYMIEYTASLRAASGVNGHSANARVGE
ncbi:MAG: hypothetical protein Q9222_002966 [Ikaeria aurantiellina]